MTEQTQTNAPVPHIFQAILEVKSHLAHAGVGKGQKNTQQGYAFRGIDDIMNAMAAPLVNAKILVIPRIQERTETIFTTDNGKRVTSVSLDTEFVFLSAVDGTSLTARIQSEASDYADKATNKAISFALKYAFISVFNIPVVGADDGDFESPGNDEPAAKVVAKKPQPVAKKTQKATEAAENPEVEHKLVTKLKAISSTELANKVASLIQRAYGVASVTEVPAEKVGEAITRINQYLANQTKTAAQPETGDDIPE